MYISHTDILIYRIYHIKADHLRRCSVPCDVIFLYSPLFSCVCVSVEIIIHTNLYQEVTKIQFNVTSISGQMYFVLLPRLHILYSIYLNVKKSHQHVCH